MYNDDSSVVFYARNAIKEAKRDPLEGLDKLALPDTMVHGQVIDDKKQSTKHNYETPAPMKDGGHSPSDADERTDKIQGTGQSKPDTVKI